MRRSFLLIVVSSSLFGGCAVINAFSEPGCESELPVCFETVGDPITEVGNAPRAVVLAEINADSNIDLIVAASGRTGAPGGVRVFPGLGAGTFDTPIVITGAGDGPVDVAVADLDGGGSPDLVIVDQRGSAVLVTDGPNFLSATKIADVTVPVAVATGSLTGTGAPDIVVFTTSNALIFANDGSGNFPALPTNTYDMGTGTITDGEVAEASGDADPDLLASTSAGLVIRLGTTGVDFTTARSLGDLGSNPYGLEVTDFSQDSVVDYAVTANGQGTVTVILGDGGGNAATAPVNPVSGPEPTGITAGDFDADGNVDLAVTNPSAAEGDTFTFLMNAGGGVFDTTQSLRTNGIEPVGIAAGDLDGDGQADLVVANAGSDTGEEQSVSIFLAVDN